MSNARASFSGPKHAALCEHLVTERTERNRLGRRSDDGTSIEPGDGLNRIRDRERYDGVTTPARGTADAMPGRCGR